MIEMTIQPPIPTGIYSPIDLIATILNSNNLSYLISEDKITEDKITGMAEAKKLLEILIGFKNSLDAKIRSLTQSPLLTMFQRKLGGTHY